MINIGRLDQIADKFLTEKESFVDLERLGYTKLLGTGKLTKSVKVKVRAYSELAAQKIKDAGGMILKGSEEEVE